MPSNTVIQYRDIGLSDTAKYLAEELVSVVSNNCNSNIKEYLEKTDTGDWRIDSMILKASNTCGNKIRIRLNRLFPFWQTAMAVGNNTVSSLADYCDGREDFSLKPKKEKYKNGFYTFQDVLDNHENLSEVTHALFQELMESIKGNSNRDLLKYLMTPFDKWDLDQIERFGSATACKLFTKRLYKLFSKKLEDLVDWPKDMESYIVHWLYMHDDSPKPETFNGTDYIGEDTSVILKDSDDFEVPDFEPEQEITLEKPAKVKIEKDVERIKETYTTQRSQPKVEITPYNLKGVCEVFVALSGGVVGGRYSEIMPGNGEIVKTIIINWADRNSAEVYIGQAIHSSKVEAFYNYELAKDFFDAKLMTSANEAMDMLSNFFRQCDSVDEIDLIRLRMNKMLENI